jgi:hypothetical protein
MAAFDVSSGPLGGPVDPRTERERALARLADLARRTREVERMRAGDRPVPLPVLRRAVFAAYRAAIAAGAGEEAERILAGDLSAP